MAASGNTVLSAEEELTHGVRDTLAAASNDLGNVDTTGDKWQALLVVADKALTNACSSHRDEDATLMAVSTAIIDVLMSDDKLSFQHIEYFLRKQDKMVWLVASKHDNAVHVPIEPRTGKTKLFSLVVSIKGPIFAMAEILAHAKSYSENFANLKHTGVLAALSHQPTLEAVRAANQTQQRG
jgi:hypothetical protein